VKPAFRVAWQLFSGVDGEFGEDFKKFIETLQNQKVSGKHL
jgi:hypothetical protein